MLGSKSNREWSGSTGGSFPTRRRHSAESSNRVSPGKAPRRKGLNSGEKIHFSRLVGGNAMDVIMPQLGETVEEGTVAAWHKKEGDKVAIDELLVEIETDKVATEVPSLVAGTLLKILVAAGETVKVGTTLAIIDSGNGRIAEAPQAAGGPAEPAQLMKPAAAAAQETPRRSKRVGRGTPLPPAVRRLVAENGIDVARIQGTGRDGRIKR